MRGVPPLPLLLLLLCAAPALAAGSDHPLTVAGLAAAPGEDMVYLKATTGDLDGDGRADEGVLRVQCSGGRLRAAAFHEVKSPRDAASGQASGRRAHAPVVFVKEWNPSTPQLRALSPRLRFEAAPAAPAPGWRPVVLSQADGLCPAALAIINTSRSNLK